MMDNIKGVTVYDVPELSYICELSLQQKNRWPTAWTSFSKDCTNLFPLLYEEQPI